ncbi:MAG: DUF560 domain-containing protein [Burkholderiaceae bacterium]|nr:DUF560 domain-containing protein [Burkholderiaceae bacterium]
MRQRFTRWGARLALAGVMGVHASLAARADPLDDLRAQVEGGQFEAAYQNVQQHPDWIGNPHFDFLLGLAAIGAGHVPEGVLALERHLTIVPANDRARLELARGYYLLGEYSRARQEFEFVLRHQPPQEVQDNIRRYLSWMQTRDNSNLRSTSKFYVDLGFGRDSDINGGTTNTQIQLITGIIQLNNSASEAMPDYYKEMAVGGQWTKGVTAELSVFAGADADSRLDNSLSAYDQASFGGYLGFSYLKGTGLYRVSVATTRLLVGGAIYNDQFAVTGEAQYAARPGLSVTGFVQYAEPTYAGDNVSRDSRIVTLGVSAVQALQRAAWNPYLGLRLSGTVEDNLRLRNDLSRRVPTARIFMGANPSDTVGVTAGLTYQLQRYEQADLGFGSIRKDDLWGLDAGVKYAVDRRWTLRCEWLYTNNSSNQQLYDFRRNAWSLKAHYEY